MGLVPVCELKKSDLHIKYMNMGYRVSPQLLYGLGLVQSNQMKRQSKFLLILLCLSLLLFKAVSGNRFIENGIKRAVIYSDYSAYILAQQEVEASGIDDKNNLTRAISVHMFAIVIGIFVLFGTTQLKQTMRAIVKILNSAQLNQKIFKPPKKIYIPI